MANFFRSVERSIRHSARGIRLDKALPIIGTGVGAFLGGPIGAGIGGMAGMLGQQTGAEDANKMNMKMAREQMKFQERMSSTAHQREVADLKKAGLNPILAANGGASSPAGASANIENTMEGSASSAQAAIQAAQEARRVAKEMTLLDSQTGLTDAQKRVAIADAKIKEGNNPPPGWWSWAMKKFIGGANSAKRVFDKKTKKWDWDKEGKTPGHFTPGQFRLF